MKNTLALVIIAAAAILAGCSQKTGDDQTTPSGTSSSASEKMKSTTQAGVTTAAGAGTTGKVRSALLARTDLKVSNLNVDTVDKTVTLKGTAASADVKSKVGEIAKSTAGSDYTVVNDLTVGK